MMESNRERRGNCDNRGRHYKRRFPKRNVELHKFSTEVAIQNFADLHAMARADGKTVGAFVDWIIEREVRRRQRKMEEQTQQPPMCAERFLEMSVCN
jgi:hypothetical protein